MESPKRRFADINQLLDHVADICPFPAAAQRLMTLIDDRDSSVEAIVGTLGADPALAEQVLRIANGAAFQRAGGTRDLRQAVVTLGLEALRTMVGPLVLLANLATGDQLSLDLQAQSAVCGSIVATTAATSAAEGRGLPFICGLLCEVGALVCLAIDGPDYVQLRMRTTSGGGPGSVSAFVALEGLEVIRYGHPARAIGARLLRRHNLPEPIATAIQATPRQLPHAPLLLRATAFARIIAPVVVRLRSGAGAMLMQEVKEAARCTSLVELDSAELVRRCVSAAEKMDRQLHVARATRPSH
jgi:HD-like signal output (HDOD) protein